MNYLGNLWHDDKDSSAAGFKIEQAAIFDCRNEHAANYVHIFVSGSHPDNRRLWLTVLHAK